MGDGSKIEWTEATWNPVVGCSRVSAGCQHCYAERVAHRGMAPQHRGLTVVGEKGPRWNGQVRFVPHVLDKPLRWKTPRRVFVNSLADLFHERLSNEQIAAVFGVMAASPQHSFQVLTKRPERMREWFRWAETGGALSPGDPIKLLRRGVADHLPGAGSDLWERLMGQVTGCPTAWPLNNVWLGCSVEDQATADERIPLLLDTPAALRWVSYEPALGRVDFRRIRCARLPGDRRFPKTIDTLTGTWRREADDWGPCSSLDWVVVGGESGPGARPCALEWVERTIAQCREAGVPCFVKQLGAHVVSERRVDPDDGSWAWRAGLNDRKGASFEQWPEYLSVREWPEVRS